jgi:hypothetical protein
MEPGLGKRLMTVLHAVYHMMRRGLCRKRLMMDLHLLLGRGKLAGKALRDLLTAASHHQHHHHMVVPRPPSRAPPTAAAGLSLPSDPQPQVDVQSFNSCTAAPSCSSGNNNGGGVARPAAAGGLGRALLPFRIRGRRGASAANGCGDDGLVLAQVARALETMHDDDADVAGHPSPLAAAAGATPSPMLALSLGRSPAGARRLRVTDSPFPLDPPEGLDARADSTFDAFISKFYETLRLQQADATPDNRARR